MMKVFSRILILMFLLMLAACSGFSTDLNGEQAEEDSLPEAPIVATDSGSLLSLCSDPQPAFIMDLNIYPVPGMTEPAAREAFRDPVFGTCLVRVTDRSRDLASDDDSRGIKNEYSRVQSFNADDSFILARSIEAFWYVYDARTLRVVARLPLDDEPRWDSQDPFRLYYNSGTQLISLNLTKGTTELIHDFRVDFSGQDLAAVWTRYEGSPSINTRYWGLMAEDSDWSTVAYLVYDMQTDQVIAKRDISGWPKQYREIDSVTISPLGTYFLAYMDRSCEDSPGSDADPCGLMVYDQDLQNGRSLLPIIGHSDLALDVKGREILVFQDIQKDDISMLDLETGQVTPLFPIDFSHSPLGFHFSGQAYRRPGWVLGSTYSGAKPSATWMDDQIFAIELVAGGRVVRLAHTHSDVDETQEHDYWAEPHASANRDFTRILFTSNWGRSGSEAVDMYMLALPEDWTEQLP